MHHAKVKGLKLANKRSKKERKKKKKEEGKGGGILGPNPNQNKTKQNKHLVYSSSQPPILTSTPPKLSPFFSLPITTSSYHSL